MKVCIYAGITPSTTFINRLILGLADSKVSILLHGHNLKGFEQFSSHPNIKVIGYKGKWSKMILSLRYLFLFCCFRPNELRTIWKELRTHNGISSRINFWIKAAPIVWYKPDLFHLQWVKWIDYWIWLKQFDIKIVTSLRGAQINYEPLVDTKLRETYAKLLPQVNGFHAVSNAIAAEAVLYGASPKQIKTVYSGLRLSDFSFNAASFPPDNSALQILSIGRDHWKKGYTYAIDAMFLLKQKGIHFQYTIIGGMSEEHLFHIKEMGLSDNITLTGNIPFAEVQSILQRSHLFILPSLEEGIANVVLEAMASGIPVICANAGGMAEAIINSESGWLVPSQDANAIANAVEDYLQTKQEQLSKIITTARQKIETRFREENMVSDMKKLYQQTIDQSF